MQMSTASASTRAPEHEPRDEMLSVMVKAPSPQTNSILARAGHGMQVGTVRAQGRPFSSLDLGGRKIEQFSDFFERGVRHRYTNRFNVFHGSLAELSRRSSHRDQNDPGALPDVNSCYQHRRIVRHITLVWSDVALENAPNSVKVPYCIKLRLDGGGRDGPRLS